MLATDAMATPPTSYVEQVEFELPIRSEEVLRDFVECAWGVQIPNTPWCRDHGLADHATPWEAFRDAYFGRVPVSVWKASRNVGGKSHLVAALGATEAATLSRCEVAVLGASEKQAQRVHESMGEFWAGESAPRQLLKREPTAELITLQNGSKVTLQTASTKSVRGPHPQRLRLDEVDEMAAKIFWTSMGQPTTKHGIRSQVVAASTHQYDAGLFEELLELAPEKRWGVYEWCLEETRATHGGWATEEMISDLQTRMSKQDWDTEVRLQRPQKGLRVFPMFSVERHAAQPVVYMPELPVYVGIDFGFLRFAWVAFQLHGNGDVRVFDSNLWRSCGSIQGGQRLAALDWARSVKRIGADPAGNARDGREGISQVHDIDAAFGKHITTYTSARPYSSPNWRAEQMRVLLADGTGDSHIKIDPSCESLIRGMRRLSYKEDSRDEIHKTDELDDPVDALGYGLVAALWMQPATFGGVRPR